MELENLKIASPCTADWESMKGDDRSRFCSLGFRFERGQCG